jgi:hypothetical protein
MFMIMSSQAASLTAKLFCGFADPSRLSIVEALRTGWHERYRAHGRLGNVWGWTASLYANYPGPVLGLLPSNAM